MGDEIHEIAAQMVICAEKDVSKIDLKKIDEKFLTSLFTEEVLGISAIRAISCLIYILLQKNSETINKLPLPSKQILKYLKVIYTVKKASLQGEVFFVKILNQNMVVKSMKEGFIMDGIKEYIIGTGGINPLRKFTPCFMATFGFFNYFGNINDKQQKVTKKYNLVVEKIDGITLFECLENKKFGISEFSEILINILMGLEIAQRECSFTHYDLHTNNVMVKKIKTPFKYSIIDYTEEYVIDVIDNLPIIIDYGYAFSDIDNTLFGHKSSLFMYPSYDMYRLLLGSAYTTKNLSLSRFIMELFEFFPNDNYEIYEKYTEIPKLPDRMMFSRIREIIIVPLKESLIKLKSSCPYLTPLQFLKKIHAAYPEQFSNFTIHRRNKFQNITIDSSEKIYRQIFSDYDDTNEEISNTIKKCITDQSSLVLNVYNLYVLKKYKHAFEDEKIYDIENYQKMISDNFPHMLKYDKLIFSEPISVNVAEITNCESKISDIFNILFTPKSDYKQFNVKKYETISPHIVKIVEEVNKLKKYLDIYYTIIELGLVKYAEYETFVRNMNGIMEKISQKNLDYIKMAHRWSVSLNQIYSLL